MVSARNMTRFNESSSNHHQRLLRNWSQNGRHGASAFHSWRLLDDDFAFQHVDELLKQFTASIVVSVFTSSEQNVDLYLVVLGKKLSSLSDLHFDVVLAGFCSHTNLLNLNGVLFGTALKLLLFLVLRLPEVHDPANWRTNSRAHFDKIQPGINREFSSFVSLHFAEHFAVLIDDADRRDPNSIIHPWQICLHGLSKLRSSDCGLLQKKLSDAALEKNFKRQLMFEICRNFCGGGCVIR